MTHSPKLEKHCTIMSLPKGNGIVHLDGIDNNIKKSKYLKHWQVQLMQIYKI